MYIIRLYGPPRGAPAVRHRSRTRKRNPDEDVNMKGVPGYAASNPASGPSFTTIPRNNPFEDVEEP
jgi:hypothetical protein